MKETKLKGRPVADPAAGKKVQIGAKVHPKVAAFLRTVSNVSQYVEQAIREKHRADKAKEKANQASR